VSEKQLITKLVRGLPHRERRPDSIVLPAEGKVLAEVLIRKDFVRVNFREKTKKPAEPTRSAGEWAAFVKPVTEENLDAVRALLLKAVEKAPAPRAAAANGKGKQEQPDPDEPVESEPRLRRRTAEQQAETGEAVGVRVVA
jgi:hypothetical protein